MIDGHLARAAGPYGVHFRESSLRLWGFVMLTTA